MKGFLRASLIVLVNLVVLAALLAGVEAYFRIWNPPNDGPAGNNGLWQVFQPYVLFTSSPGPYSSWHNNFTGEQYSATIVTNSLGFNDRREFSYTEPYKKAPNEKVVLFASGSVGWGVGATATDKTVAGRIEHYLNSLQSELKYSVVNLSMGSWIAYQQFIALQLWGEAFDPDWVVAMDGHNDAAVGCAHSQGVGNPMYFGTIKSYIDAYLLSKVRPVFFRGWLENELVKRSAAYRSLTGKEPIAYKQAVDETSTDTRIGNRFVLPTKMGESHGVLDFYIKAQRGMLSLFPNAGFILSTQPTVNDFTGHFVDVYEAPADSEQHWAAMDKREQDIEAYLAQYKDQDCHEKTADPSFTYVYVNGAFRLERLAHEARGRGRSVEYYNTGLLFPDKRAERMPYFIDPAHLSDKGADVLGKFYAERILASAAKATVSRKSKASESAVDTTPKAGISIISALYGENCGATRNATAALGRACNGRETCDYVVDVDKLGDPAPRCEKSFKVEYRCGSTRLTSELPPGAGLKDQLNLSCAQPATAQVPAPAVTAAAPGVTSGLNIRTATYGGNCGAPSGNATRDIANSCNGRPDCTYVVDVDRLRDPAPRCSKEFAVEYSCAPGTALMRKYLPDEAGRRGRLELSCAPPATEQVAAREGVVASGLNIRTATYGGNCGAPSGNATWDVVNSCNGRWECTYVVDVDRLRDPADGCSKDFLVEYSCATDTGLARKALRPEAGHKSQLEMKCLSGSNQ